MIIHYQWRENSKDWWKNIAGLADRTKETVLTYKFGLEYANQYIEFSDSQKAHTITEGIGKGSLTGLLLALHLSVFCLVAKGAETKGKHFCAYYTLFFPFDSVT